MPRQPSHGVSAYDTRSPQLSRQGVQDRSKCALSASIWPEGEPLPGFEAIYTSAAVSQGEITEAWEKLRRAWSSTGVKIVNVSIRPPNAIKIGGFAVNGAAVFVEQLANLLTKSYGKDMTLGRGTLLVRVAPEVFQDSRGSFVRCRFGFARTAQELAEAGAL
jgi:hypothetical protein